MTDVGASEKHNAAYHPAIETTCARCNKPVTVPPTGVLVHGCGMRIWANDYTTTTPLTEWEQALLNGEWA